MLFYEFKKEIFKMKKYLILLLLIVFATSILFMGISCKEEVLPAVEESYEGQSGLTNSQPDALIGVL